MHSDVRWTPARVLALFFVWLALSAWLRPLALPDEGRYVGVAWEMLRSGDWRVPTLDGLPFFHKPPLFYWITATSLKLLGLHGWSARSAPLLGALLAGASLYLLLRRRADEATARGALAMLATLPFFYGGAQYANLDMLVAGCITATIAAGADAVCALALGQPHRRSLLLAWGLAGLGVLAKGLIGIVLPGAVLLLWLLLSGRPRLILRLLWWPGPLLLLLVAGPWFVAMQERFPDFLHYFFVYQHFQRFAETGFNNQQPVWFYVPATLLLTLPGSAGLWWALRRRAPVGPAPLKLASLMVIWLVVIIGFFSMPRSKLIGYVLPCLPPLAALLAVAWRNALAPRWQRALLAAGGTLSLGAMVAVAVLDDKTAAPLVPTLQAQRQPGQPLVFVDSYPYDLPLLLREPGTVPVLTDWHNAETLRRDSWEKELFEAGEFDQAAAGRVLVDQHDMAALLCPHPVNWLVMPAGRQRPELASAQQVAATRHLVLWKLDLSARSARAALGCAETPTSG